jgi:hypothetical protein
MFKKWMLASLCAFVGLTGSAKAGSVFLTGHDPDFHAVAGGNAIGAQHINQVAINFVRDPSANPFKVGGSKFLLVESNIVPPGGHLDGEAGINLSGYIAGVDYERHGASTGLLAELALLGTKYDSIVVMSDFGGILTQAELDILNANSAAIISFLNSGGGLYAMAEGNGGAGLTPNGGWFGYLPFIVTSVNLDASESGYTVTPYGQSLGLTANDVNGNFSHNIFTSTGGMNIVDQNAAGAILSLATRSQINNGGVVPVPVPAAAWAGLGTLAALGVVRRVKKSRAKAVNA